MNGNRKLDDGIYQVKMRVRRQAALTAQAALLRLTRLHELATWRLNEREASLPATVIALGYTPRSFYYPYGQRRPMLEDHCHMQNERYASLLPAHHRGNPAKMTPTIMSDYNYPVANYLRQQERIEGIYERYRVNWLGRFVRK